ncbi:MAG TPA: hypothetical protein PLS87_11445 [Ferruginibacter sp.]|nr:hypothetical protein [Ferruginibacter sp.]HRO97570.1 hypothetical protein [Ferruginibacter sp.]
MKNFHQSVLDVLEAAKKKIISITVSEHEGHGLLKRRVIDDLSKTITAVGITNNSVSESDTPPELPKVKTMLGKHIGPAPVTPPAPAPTPSEQDQERKQRKSIQADNEAELFVKRIEFIYPEFSKMSNEEIFNSLSDMEIRGVARKAKLSFTETDPETITTATLDEIREAIKKRNEIEQQLGKTNEGIDETKTVKAGASDFNTVTTLVHSPEAEHAYSLINRLYDEQSSDLAEMDDEDKCFNVKNEIYDGYGDWLRKGSAWEDDENLIKGLKARTQRLYFKGIELIPNATKEETKGNEAILTVRKHKTIKADPENNKEEKNEPAKAKPKTGK